MKTVIKSKSVAVGLALMLGAGSSASFAEAESPAINIKRLSMEMALKAAEGAIHECRTKGIQIGVTVVDRSGEPQVVLRDVLAPDLTLTISRMKAYTAISFTSATSALGSRGDGALGRVPGLFFGAGGVPIEAGGQVYGAIGVSGAPSGKTDEECARAGAKAVENELNFM